MTNGPSKIELGSFSAEPFFDLRDQALGANPQALRQPKYGLKGRLSHTTLKHRDKRRVQVALQSEGLLGESRFQAPSSHHITECLAPRKNFFRSYRIARLPSERIVVRHLPWGNNGV